MLRLVLLTLVLFFSVASLFAQTTKITGEVFAADTEKPLSGATVMIENTTKGVVTDENGRFKMEVDLTNEPVLVVTMLGFAEQRIPLSDTMTELSVKLREEAVLMNTTVVSASRVEQNILQAPVSIEKLSLREIKSTPAQNVYDAVTQMKGVDVVASSMTWKSYNTRGFNAPANSRFVQRLDGVDMQAPGLNMATGALNGSNDLDVQSIEVIPGAASALYGPNAFNGLMNVHTKDAFEYPGLSASIRGGVNHVNSGDQNVDPQPLFDVNVRYAKPITRRFAVKANLGYMRASDWRATDYRDFGNYAGAVNEPGLNSAGYDGLNIYGDEVASVIDTSTYPVETFDLIGLLPDSIYLAQNGIPPTRVGRTGYREEDLTDYGVDNIKADITLSYKFNENLRLDGTARVSRGSSVLQADNRIMIDNFLFQNYALELSSDKFFIRGYTTQENSGDSYDLRFAAFNVNRAWKSDENWFAQYNIAYFGFLDAFSRTGILNTPIPEDRMPTPGDPVAARQFADSDNTDLIPYIQDVSPFFADIAEQAVLFEGEARYEPGTPEFENALREVRQSTNWDDGGAKFVDKSSLYHFETQYDFSEDLKFMELIVGGNGRMYRLDSDGLIFGDTTGPINVYEYGAYAQASRGFIDDRLRLTASARIDKITNFEPRITPRLAGVLLLGEKRNHNIRASYQTGFRMPPLRNQYLALNLGPVRAVGGFQNTFDRFGLTTVNVEGETIGNAFSINSVNAFQNSGDSTDLRRLSMDPIRQEFVRTVELGYKGFPIKNLMIDVNVFFNQYDDFIGNVLFAGPTLDEVGTPDQPLTTAELADDDSVQIFQRAINFNNTVFSQGVSAGFLLFLNRQYSIRGNYSWMTFQTEEGENEDFRAEFNTPEHRFNVGFAGRDLLKSKKLGFGVNYRWIDTFFYQFVFADGEVPSYSILDAQVTYKLPKYKSEVSVGGTNLLNDRHFEAPGGPTIGTMLYVQLTFDQLMN